jgi:excisionase family DNA binding protein
VTGNSDFFQPYRLVASRLGVPAAWLRAEAEAGRLPHLRAGRQILVHPDQVEKALLDRAAVVGKAQDISQNIGSEPAHA